MSTTELTQEMSQLEVGLLEFAQKLTRDRSDAFDLYQEMAYRAIKNAHQFQPDTNLRAWLMTIMRNLFINSYRKKRRRQTIQDNSIDHYLINSTSQTVWNEGEVNLNYGELMELINRLDDYLRIPFMLAYKGYRYDEISQELQIPLGTVKSRIFVARKQIQRAMNKEKMALETI